MNDNTAEPFIIRVAFLRTCDACGEYQPDPNECICAPCKAKLFPRATITKTQDAQPVGVYEPTSVDAAKAAADFRVLSVDPYVIAWKDGRTERVTSKRLYKLQNSYTWATDF